MKLVNFDPEKERKKNQRKLELSLNRDIFKALAEISDSEQLKVLESIDDRFTLTGPAGSGKTMLALSKLHLLEENGDTYIMIVYTKALKKYIQQKMEDADFKKTYNKIYYLDEFYGKINEQEKVDYVIVDEAQDIPEYKINEIINLSKKGFYLYGDNVQSIYPSKTGPDYNFTDNDSISKHEYTQHVLKMIYRFSESLYLFANPINPNSNDTMCYFKDSENENKPQVYHFSSSNYELNYIANLINSNKSEWANLQIGILARNRFHADEIFNWFQTNYDNFGISIEAKYNDQDKDSYLDLDFSNNKPKLITYHSSKGIEFDIVFIPFCNVYENKNDKEFNYQEALYVALTRTKKKLFVSFNGNQVNEDHNNTKGTSGISPYLGKIDLKHYNYEYIK